MCVRACVTCSFRALYGHTDNENSTGFYGSPSLSSAKKYLHSIVTIFIQTVFISTVLVLWLSASTSVRSKGLHPNYFLRPWSCGWDQPYWTSHPPTFAVVQALLMRIFTSVTVNVQHINANSIKKLLNWYSLWQCLLVMTWFLDIFRRHGSGKLCQ